MDLLLQWLICQNPSLSCFLIWCHTSPLTFCMLALLQLKMLTLATAWMLQSHSCKILSQPQQQNLDHSNFSKPLLHFAFERKGVSWSKGRWTALKDKHLSVCQPANGPYVYSAEDWREARTSMRQTLSSPAYVRAVHWNLHLMHDKWDCTEQRGCW